MVQGRDVVHDLGHVGRAVRIMDVGFRAQQVPQGALGALDLTGENRLPAHEHEHEQIRIRQYLDSAIDAAERLVGARQQCLKL